MISGVYPVGRPAICGYCNTAIWKTAMPLPKPNETTETNRPQAFVQQRTPEELGRFPILRRSDMQLIGTYIQIYNYIDMHLRRCIEIFARRDMLSANFGKKYTRIPASKLTSTLRPIFLAMPSTEEDVAVAILHFDNIDVGRPLRHLLAHWAARKIPNEDAIVLLTKYEPDAEQIGIQLNPYGAATAILHMQDIRERIEVIGSYENWLGVKTSEWFKRYVPTSE